MPSTTAKKMKINALIALSLFCGTVGAFVINPTTPVPQKTRSEYDTSFGYTCLQSSRGGIQADRSSAPRTQGNNNNRSNNPKAGGPRRYNNDFNRGPGGAAGGGGGGGSPVLKMVNPLKILRVVEQVAQTDEERADSQQAYQERQQNRNQRQEQGGGRNSGPRRPVASASAGPNGAVAAGPSDGGSEYSSPRTFSGDDAGPGGKDFGRKRTAKPQKRGVAGGANNDDRRGARKRGGTEDGRNSRRTSLRVGNSRGGTKNRRRGSLRKRDRSAEKEARAEAALERKTVTLPEGPISVSELATIIDEKPVAVIKLLMTDLGVMASMTQNLDPATCIAVVEGFGKVIGGDDDYDEDDDDEMFDDFDEDSALYTGYVEDEDDPEDLKPRAPVVTIMGHVDHGKTSLLDAIRKTDVTAGEAGGITQHIAAYQVSHQDQVITFIDTPGHSAFTDMRERGANITDIVILVVAADDGVKQQTVDSINCARQAGVPIVVAINKCDLETADVTKVMSELTAYDILTEEFGGDVLVSQVSAKTEANLDDLLDKVMIQAELQELRANPDRSADGIVVEANVERGLGTVATSLIKKGTLRVGDIFVAGETYGRVRAMISTADGKTRLDEATPGMPVQIVGFEGIPSAGDILTVAETEQLARELAESRQRIAREKESSLYQSDLMSSVARSFGSSKEHREMCVLVKADVQGSAEALTRALRELKLENEEASVTVKVLVSEAGEVSKSDISIASVTPGTTVLAFGVAASYAAMEDARINGVNIEYYDIVYDAIESVESRMQEVLSPTPEGEYVGSALVQEVFNIGGTGNIAGSRCRDGFIKKGSNVRVMRGDKILVESRVKTLRNFKAETDRIEEGNECGIGLEGFEDFLAGDVIESYMD